MSRILVLSSNITTSAFYRLDRRLDDIRLCREYVRI